MAYRRRQGMGRSSTFKEEIYRPPPEEEKERDSKSSSLAAQAIKAHRDLSHFKGGPPTPTPTPTPTYDYTSMGSSNEAGSFWGVLARKAKAIIEDDHHHQSEYLSIQTRPEMSHSDQVESYYNMDNPTLRKRLDSLTTSMNRIGDTIGNALEEGRTIVENKTSDIIEETRRLQIRRKGSNEGQNHLVSGACRPTQPQNQTSQEDQLKASRDVAMATAAKAKVLLRELKTVKAELAFAKERCSQLEEENKILRDGRDKGVNPADDDMIRLQLETLLAEKGRLANENSVYARENRFLREIVEYHQMTMQDVVYLDEEEEEVQEVYRTLSVSPPSNNSICRSSSLPAILHPRQEEEEED